MNSPTIEEVRSNFLLPPIEVKHKDLIRVGNSVFRSKCPICTDGILLVRRDESHKLCKDDNCVSCGRRFVYVDIKEEISLKYI